jgi:hypothetical protein
MLAQRIRTLLLLIPTLLPLLSAQDLTQYKQMWSARRYQDVVNALIDLGGASFEVDYMLGTAMCQVPAVSSNGYDYLQSLYQIYAQPFTFDGQPVDLTAAERQYCQAASVATGPAPNSGGPGVTAVMMAPRPPTMPSPSQAIAQARDKLGRGTAAQADTLRIVSILPRIGARVPSAGPVEFRARLHYTLNSASQAILTVYAEHYRNGPQACKGTVHQTEGGKTFPIHKGEGDVDVAFDWVKSARPKSQVPPGAGYLNMDANIWTDKDGKPAPPIIKRFEFSPCYALLP